MPQDLTLFNESIYYNIAYGREGASEEEVYRAARRAAIDTQVCCELGDEGSGYHTMMQLLAYPMLHCPQAGCLPLTASWQWLAQDSLADPVSEDRSGWCCSAVSRRSRGRSWP